MKARFAAKLLISLWLGLLIVACQSVPGSLDPTFGNDGKVFSDVDAVVAIAIQADGKIVTVGNTLSTYLTPSGFALYRYNPDGTPDCTFGTCGAVITNSSGDGHDLAASAIAIHDGKIVIAGTIRNNDTYYDVALLRYASDGSLDPTFGNNGMVTTDVAGGNDSATAVAIQFDGKIVVGGNTSPDNLLLVRYNSDGSLDSTFGNEGKVITDMNRHGEARAVMIQADGKIVVAGSGNSNEKMFNFAVLRYNVDGSLDPSFGNGGIVLTGLGKDYDGANGEAIQSDGKIVVVGRSSIVRGRFTLALLRYNTDGSLDPTFGDEGKAIDDLTDGDAASGVAIQSDGKIVVSGNTYHADNTSNFLLVRYNRDGSLDRSFGIDGKVTTILGGYDFTSAVAIQSDGNIVVAGSTRTMVTSAIPLPRGGGNVSSRGMLLRYLR